MKNLSSELKNELQNNIIWKKYYNNLCDYLYIFIHKAIDLIEEEGELIFVTPEYWLKNLHSKNLRNYITDNGFISDIYYFNETPIFDRVNTSTIIFKFIKSKNKKEVNIFKYLSKKKLNKKNLYEALSNKNLFFKKKQFKKNEKWLIFNDNEIDDCNKIINSCLIKNNQLKIFNENIYSCLKDICNIGNGLVSGLDKAFICDDQLYQKLNSKEKKSIIKVLKAYNLEKYFNSDYQNYIFLNNKTITNFEKEYPSFFNHFQKFKAELSNRYNYNKKINYWDWVFLRNFKLFNSDKVKISIPCKLRVKTFSDIKFSYTENDFFPTQDVTSIYLKDNTKEDIYYVLAYLNYDLVKKWIFINNNNRGNILEFSEKPLNEIPFRLIDWSKKNEVAVYNNISNWTKEIITTKNYNNIKLINEAFNSLIYINGRNTST